MQVCYEIFAYPKNINTLKCSDYCVWFSLKRSLKVCGRFLLVESKPDLKCSKNNYTLLVTVQSK